MMCRGRMMTPKIWLLCIVCCVLLILAGCLQRGRQNRLQFATSPYLKEHADNPVDWYEWGDEALNKAKQENKPLIISIGYASCHWCHEMAKESFSDTAVARIMNENFVCVKVDREERPDIDQIYMNALQLLTGEGGWPLNAFALPDGKPFYAGTYYTKKDWINLLQGVSKAYQTKHNLVVTQAGALLNGIAEQELSLIDTGTVATAKPRPVYTTFYDSIYKQADLVNGGLKGRQKFPTPAFAEYLLQHYYITKNAASLGAATNTLDKMALGGLYDHLAGGFYRYSVDSLWRVPHFEKMLYDNGQLVSLYAHAYQLTKNNFYKDIVVETLDFIERTFAAPGGGYYSSINADTKDGEGAFYAWSANEFTRVAGNDQMVADYFHVTKEGNWKAGQNLLYSNQTSEEFAAAKKTDSVAFTAKLTAAKNKLLKERSKRAAPSVDTKIITAWNGILIKAYADAYAATGTDLYLEKAKNCATFIEKNLLGKDGGLQRNFIGGKAAINGFLDDYAWIIASFLRLYEVSFDYHWLMLSKQLMDRANRDFYNTATGLFYFSEKQAAMVMRKTEIADDAIPSANAVMAKSLFTLGNLFADTSYTNRSLKMYAAVTARVQKMPAYHIQWCSFASVLSARSYEVAIVGKDAVKKNRELQQNYLPTSFFMGGEKEGTLPLLENKLIDGKTMIYVCSDKLCKRPEEIPAKAILQIK
jgi:uncharacterized protein YyaL (SSP411 family)